MTTERRYSLNPYKLKDNDNLHFMVINNIDKTKPFYFTNEGSMEELNKHHYLNIIFFANKHLVEGKLTFTIGDYSILQAYLSTHELNSDNLYLKDLNKLLVDKITV